MSYKNIHDLRDAAIKLTDVVETLQESGADTRSGEELIRITKFAASMLSQEESSPIPNNFIEGVIEMANRYIKEHKNLKKSRGVKKSSTKPKRKVIKCKC